MRRVVRQLLLKQQQLARAHLMLLQRHPLVLTLYQLAVAATITIVVEDIASAAVDVEVKDVAAARHDEDEAIGYLFLPSLFLFVVVMIYVDVVFTLFRYIRSCH